MWSAESLRKCGYRPIYGVYHQENMGEMVAGEMASGFSLYAANDFKEIKSDSLATFLVDAEFE